MIQRNWASWAKGVANRVKMIIAFFYFGDLAAETEPHRHVSMCDSGLASSLETPSVVHLSSPHESHQTRVREFFKLLVAIQTFFLECTMR